MSAPAPLRLVVSRAEAPFEISPALAFRPAPPLAATAGDKPFLVAAALALAIHAAALAWMVAGPSDDAARSAGAAEDLILLEGIPVELVESMPTPEAPPTEAAVEPETAVEEAPPEVPEETIEPPPDPPDPVEPVPPPEEPPPPPPQSEPEPEPPTPVDEALPPAEAETGELPARPDEMPPALEPPPEETPPPVVEPPPPPEETPPEQPPPEEEPAEPPPPDPKTVPPPRPRPERTVVAEKPPAPKPAEQKPAAPPPSAPTASSSAARSGGAGGGGAAQTAGKAAESAYRAQVAAKLARSKFYPNAARRDRLTGRATVRFTLNASGRVTAVKVVRSAGSRILDDAAVDMVRRAAPYPPIPRGLGATITIQAPIGFQVPR